MEDWYQQYVLAKRRGAEDIEAARKHQLEIEALAARRTVRSSSGVLAFFHRLIYSLRCRLIAWNCWLQAHFGISPAPALVEDDRSPCA